MLNVKLYVWSKPQMRTINQLTIFMKKTNKSYESPAIEVVELVVESGFEGSIGSFDPEDADPIQSLDKWTDWED